MTRKTPAHINRGFVYHSKGDDNAAIGEFTEAIRVNPNNNTSGALLWRSTAYYLRHDYDAAIADYTEAIRLDPKNACAYGWRSAYEWRSGSGH